MRFYAILYKVQSKCGCEIKCTYIKIKFLRYKHNYPITFSLKFSIKFVLLTLATIFFYVEIVGKIERGKIEEIKTKMRHE